MYRYRFYIFPLGLGDCLFLGRKTEATTTTISTASLAGESEIWTVLDLENEGKRNLTPGYLPWIDIPVFVRHFFKFVMQTPLDWWIEYVWRRVLL